MYRVWSLGLACCLLLLGCGGGGSSAPAAPGAVQLQAAYDPAKLLITLTWAAPGGAVDGYNLEARVGSGAFTQLNTSLIGGGVTTMHLTFTSAPPELTILGFRVYAVRGGLVGPSSNVPEIQIPLNGPTYVAATYTAPLRGVAVTWDTPSRVADRYVLERATCDAAGTVDGPWTALPLASPLAGSHLDTDVSEVHHYRYRATAWSGGIASTTADPGPGQAVAIPPLAPTAFTAQALPGAVALTWVNQSQTATQIQITRSLPGGLGGTAVAATLPATATAFQDGGLPLGYFVYGISVSDGQSTTAGPTLLAAAANPTGAPALAASTLGGGTPSVNASALCPAGQWAFGTTSPFTILPAGWGAWPAWSPTDPLTSEHEFLQLDAQSQPHALYAIQGAAGATVTHAWFDGAAWTTEVVAQAAPGGALSAEGFCLDGTGSPQTVLTTDAGRFFTRRVAGTWVQEPLDPSNTAVGEAHLALDPAGTPHVLIPTPTDTLEFSRQADGTWTAQALPNPLAPGELYAFEEGVWADGATAWVVYKVPNAADYRKDDLWALRKVAGTWQAPVLLKTFPATGLAGSAALGLSPDGTRIVAACYQPNGLFLYTWTGQDWLESLLPLPTLDTPYVKVAFDGANRLHVLVRPSGSSPDLVDLHE